MLMRDANPGPNALTAAVVIVIGGCPEMKGATGGGARMKLFAGGRV